MAQKALLESKGAFAFQIEFDVSETETHKSTAKVTQHPVESGAQISDHVINEADTLDLIAWITNTPIVKEADALTLDPSRAENAYAELLTIKQTGTQCNVITTLRSYDTMLITELSITRDRNTGQAISISLKLINVRTATNQTVEAPAPKVLRGNPVKDQGKKTTDAAPADVTEKNKTILLQLGQKLSDNITSLTGG